MIESRKSYCKESRVQFFGPLCIYCMHENKKTMMAIAYYHSFTISHSQQQVTTVNKWTRTPQCTDTVGLATRTTWL